jgi:plastocyanin
MNHRVIFLRKKPIYIITLGVVSVLAVMLWIWNQSEVMTVSVTSASEREIHMVTGEFSAVTKDGSKIEAYRWDPGTIFVEKGEHIKLNIHGVNGDVHPFVIEGMQIQDTVKKGETTTVHLHATKEGVYRIICLKHPDVANDGPMIGYIVVD